MEIKDRVLIVEDDKNIRKLYRRSWRPMIKM